MSSSSPHSPAPKFQRLLRDFLEARPTAICATVLFIGSSFLLYMKVCKGSGPFVFATILGCITLNISLLQVDTQLYPYLLYLVSHRLKSSSHSLHSTLSILASIFIFTETNNRQFGKRLGAVFDNLWKG